MSDDLIEEDNGGCACAYTEWAIDCPIPYHREHAQREQVIAVFKDLKPDSLPFELVESVAKAIINADIPNMGDVWPWPAGDEAWEVVARERARETARAALKAILTWGS